MTEQEDENEGDITVRPSAGECVERLPSKRTFQESQPSHPGESKFEARAPDGSSENRHWLSARRHC